MIGHEGCYVCCWFAAGIERQRDAVLLYLITIELRCVNIQKLRSCKPCQELAMKNHPHDMLLTSIANKVIYIKQHIRVPTSLYPMLIRQPRCLPLAHYSVLGLFPRHKTLNCSQFLRGSRASNIHRDDNALHYGNASHARPCHGNYSPCTAFRRMRTGSSRGA